MMEEPGASKNIRPKTQAQLGEEYSAYLLGLFQRAQAKDGFNFILTVLRFDGASFGMWDPMVEASEALEDYSELIREAASDPGKLNRLYRLSILVYCHAIEMSAPYEILHNVLRCIEGKAYQMRPFSHLVRQNKRRRGALWKDAIPPGPASKIAELRKSCQRMGETRLIEIFESFYRQDIRNAFYHSDYCLDLEQRKLNIPAIPFARSISLQEVDGILARAFAFYEAFFHTYYGMRFAMKDLKRFHRMRRYEVLELLSDEKEGLFGFTIHISNGTECSFERHRDKVIAQNVMFEKEGISLHVGLLDDLRKEWQVRGVPYREPMDRDRYNRDGEWKPIVYPETTDHIQAEVCRLSDDPKVQGCLFYARCTGQLAIEFYVRGPLDTGSTTLTLENGLRLYRCDWLSQKREASELHVYDGTLPLVEVSTKGVTEGLTEIDLSLKQLAGLKYAECNWDVKYSMTTRGGRVTRREDEAICVTFNFSDPRNILVVSDERMLPTHDWKIKLEWLS